MKKREKIQQIPEWDELVQGLRDAVAKLRPGSEYPVIAAKEGDDWILRNNLRFAIEMIEMSIKHASHWE